MDTRFLTCIATFILAAALIGCSGESRRTHDNPVAANARGSGADDDTPAGYAATLDTAGTIQVTLPTISYVQLYVENVGGYRVRRLIEGVVTGGATLTWDLRNDDGDLVRDGVYFIHMKASTFEKYIVFRVASGRIKL